MFQAGDRQNKTSDITNSGDESQTKVSYDLVFKNDAANHS